MIAAAPTPQLFGPAPAAAQDANQILADQTPLSSMNNKALNARIKALRGLIHSSDLSKAQKHDARTKMKQAQAELKARRATAKQAPSNQQTGSRRSRNNKNSKSRKRRRPRRPSKSPQLQAIINDHRPLDKLSDADLRARIKAGMEARKTGNLAPADKQAINQFVPQARAELKKRRTAEQQTQKTQKQQKQQKQQPQKTQKTQQRSPQLQAIINDHRPLDKLSDADLRARIKAGMEARKAGNLAPADKQAINQFVPQARTELKKRRTAEQQTQKTQKQQKQQQQQPQKTQKTQAQSPQLQAIINDHRPLDKLSDADLRARIRAGVEARKTGNLAPADKQAINQFVPQARAEVEEAPDGQAGQWQPDQEE